ncbi:hypothetical protein DHD80_02280 [Gramella sp. AN32]|nr:hypothetical protein [Gramella sp. AN32]
MHLIIATILKILKKWKKYFALGTCLVGRQVATESPQLLSAARTYSEKPGTKCNAQINLIVIFVTFCDIFTYKYVQELFIIKNPTKDR